MQVAICVATHRRPRLLTELLGGLASQTFTTLPEPAVQVIVADNDAAGTAQEVCRTFQRWPLIYRIEGRRGIAQARNCALAERGDADFVLFIDDDEVPDPDWMEQLLIAQASFAAGVVSGPVVPVLSGDAPRWLQQGRFFDSPPFETGQVVDSCATNNTLVSRAVFDSVPRFEERFQLSGVDDLHFFRRVHRSGFPIVWCKEAIVRETVTADRASLQWLIRRSFRGGNGAVLVESALDSGLRTRSLRFLKAVARIAQGSLWLVWSLFKGRTEMVQALRRVSLGVGMLAGLFDYTYQSHQVTTGE